MNRPIARALLIGLPVALVLAGCATSSDKHERDASDAAPSHRARAGSALPTIGGATIDPGATIAANAAKAPTLTTLVKAIEAAGMEGMLSDAGPYTLFAPTNDAFGRLAPGTVDTLLKPENKSSLTKLLRYHVVAGALSSRQLRDRIEAGGGNATLVTLEGDPLTVSLTGAIITLTDVNGNRSYIEAGDVPQSNGIIQVVNGVMIPDLA